MAKKKITQLPAASALDGTELIEVVQAGASKKAPIGAGGLRSPLTGNVTFDLAGSFLNFVDVAGTLSVEFSPGANLIQLLSGLASGLQLDGAIGRTTLGDSGGQGNGTTIVIEDIAKTIVANIDGVEYNLKPAIEVIGQRFDQVGNVGTAETDLHSFVVDAGKLANNGENLFGEFIGTVTGNSLATLTINLINNGVTTNIFDSGLLTASGAGTVYSWDIKFNATRVSGSNIKTEVNCVGSLSPNVKSAYKDILLLDLSLPITLQLTGTSSVGSDKIFSEFSKIFKAAAV